MTEEDIDVSTKKRVVILLEEEEFRALEVLSDSFGFSPSQMTKYVLLGELGLPRDNALPRQTLEKQLEDFVRAQKAGTTFYASSAFGDQWWKLSTGEKRALAWHLKKLEEQGLCGKTGEKRPNGTNEYRRI